MNNTLRYASWCVIVLIILSENNTCAQNTIREYSIYSKKNVGVAVSNTFFTSVINPNFDSRYENTLTQEYNMVVAENAMKPDALQPQPGKFNFNRADTLVNFARRHGMKVRGHCLVWHEQIPKWMNDTTLTREKLLMIMETYITMVVSRYKGRITEWDVVNEAIDAKYPDNFRRTIWYKVIGPDFIDSAFVYAHRADPNALLFYNDYEAEEMNKKSDAVFNLIKRLKTKGIPISGVGLQSHFIVDSINIEGIEKNMKRLDSIGLVANITELDIRIPAEKIGTEEYAIKQAKDYACLMSLCLKQKNCHSIMFWGLSDKYSWIPGFYKNKYGSALLLNEDYTKKKAYYAIIDQLKVSKSY